MTLERPGLEPVRGLRLAMVSNCAPWTYLGPRRLVPSPHASFAHGLDVFAMTSLQPLSTSKHVVELVLGRPDGPHGRDVVHLHDASSFTIRAESPLPFQLDGDYLGRRAAVEFRRRPRGALRHRLNRVIIGRFGRNHGRM